MVTWPTREALLELLARRVPKDGIGCFLCGYMLRDLELHGELTGWPVDAMGAGMFPRASKLEHLKLELGQAVNS